LVTADLIIVSVSVSTLQQAATAASLAAVAAG
jgi:hypothetical protein